MGMRLRAQGTGSREKTEDLKPQICGYSFLSRIDVLKDGTARRVAKFENSLNFLRVTRIYRLNKQAELQGLASRNKSR
jgi:hypothetical protein